MNIAWNTMSSKKKAVFVISIAVIILTSGIILYQLCKRFTIEPIKYYYFPVWHVQPKGNYGSILRIPNPDPFPLSFPITDKEYEPDMKGYPVGYCKKCKMPFAFITEKYEPGMQPEKCPVCGTVDQKSLIVLDDAIKVIDFDVRHAFASLATDRNLKKFPRLWEYWLKLQKNNGAEGNGTQGDRKK